MKNKTRLLSILILFSSAFAFCDAKLHYFIKPCISISHGEYSELLYNPEENSDLQWEQNGIVSLGLDSIITINNFSMGFDVSFGIPGNYGNMEDFDWIGNFLDIYSIHENKTTNKIELEFSTLYDIKIGSYFSAAPQFSFYYASNSFEARNGRRWESGTDTIKKAGKVDYKHENYYFFLGLNTKLFCKGFSVGLTGLFSPYGYTYGYDYHITREFYTDQYIYSYFTRYCTKIDINKAFTENFSAGFSIQGIFGPIDRGSLYWDGEFQSKTAAGNKEYSVRSSFNVAYRL